jgi:HPt (histidine-containing phosphotransfer) domain-containing protein
VTLNEPPLLDPHPLNDLLAMGASSDLVRELIDLFGADVPPRLAVLQAAANSRDAQAIFHEAHQLKGASGNLGLRRFADLAARLEPEAQAASWARAGELVDDLSTAFGASLQALDQAFPRG